MPFFKSFSPDVETWIADHPEGHILTAHHPVDPMRIMLHRPVCPTIPHPDDPTSMWVCSERNTDLEYWVKSLGFGNPPIHRCEICAPANSESDYWWPWTHWRLRHGPDYDAGDPDRSKSVFRQSTNFRAMRIVVDVATVDPSSENPKLRYLVEFLRSGSVEILFYRYGELPDNEEILRLTYFDHGVVAGWLLNKPQHQNRAKYVYYLDSDGETVHGTGYDGEDTRFDLIAPSPEHGVYVGFPNGDHYEPEDLHGFLAAEAVNADLYITASPTLHEHERFLVNVGVENTSLVTPDAALPLIGLYLRQSDKFIRAVHDMGTYMFPSYLGAGLFYSAAIRELIPAIWNWSQTCARITLFNKGSEIVAFAQATIDRLERSLRARDDLLAMTALPVTGESSKEILSLLDQICLWLVGALDAAAIVADQTMGLGSKERQIGWQHPAWLAKAKGSCPDLAAEVGKGASGRRVLDVLLGLRNTVHSQASYPAYRSPGKTDNELFVLVSASRRKRILEAIDAEGGRLAWGVYGISDDVYYLHPAEFIEKLLPCVYALMNRLMEMTPLERSFHPGPGLVLKESPMERDNPWGPDTGRRIRWQLGL